MTFSKATAAVLVCLPAWAGAAVPDHAPAITCSAALDAYAPGSWSCAGNLIVSGGTLSGYESLIFTAKDALVLDDVHLQATRILFSSGSIAMGGDIRLDVSDTVTLTSNLLPAWPDHGSPLSAGATLSALPDSFQAGGDRIWYHAGTLIMQGDRDLMTVTWPTLTLVPEPAAWQFALLGGLLLAARSRRRA